MIPADQDALIPATIGRTRAPGDPDNVVVSGWQTYDNKGRIVEKYEPFYSTGWDYAQPGEAQRGQKATTFYDPRGHAIRTVNPDGSEQRVILGIPPDLTDPDTHDPTPWETYTYDANDNAGRTHPAVAESYRDHWNTPASIEVDALGRTITATARNGSDPATDWYTTRNAYNIQGNLVSIHDPLVSITEPLGREAFTYRFDLAKRRWRADSIDAGRRDTVFDALGQPIEGRDSKGALTLGASDLLRRPIRVWARNDTDRAVTLRQRIDYGDAGDPAQPAGDRAAAREHNLLGRPVRHYDEAGLVTVDAVDFKGNVLESARQVIADAPILATYDRAAADGWRVVPFQVDWQPANGQTQASRDAELLEPGGYQTTTSYDALNRITRHVLPTDADGRRREFHPAYNRAGALEQVRLDGTVYVQRIGYDAKGQRTLIAYGNGVMTRYAYDPHTFRLARLRSEHYTLTSDAAYRPSGQPLQDYGYGYDLVGNILTIHDRTPGSGVPRNPAAFAAQGTPLGRLLISGDALDRHFTYDPIYRLLTATGRECGAPPAGPPWTDIPRCTDPTRTRSYTESYQYDPTGSMLQLAHAASSGFTRDFSVESGSNRLTHMQTGTLGYQYTYDANGNLRTETTSRHFDWNHADQLTAFATQTNGTEPSIHAQYLYDAAGNRLKKLVRKQGGQIEVTHYLDSGFEYKRWRGGHNNRIHVIDTHERIATVRVGVAEPGESTPSILFALGDHLGSSNVVVDSEGNLVNREEYSPYGESAFGSFVTKRYRYTGKERDRDSGFYYHGARYYAPWLGRWTSCDPAPSGDGASLYTYAQQDPLNKKDSTGLQAEQPNKARLTEHEAHNVSVSTSKAPGTGGPDGEAGFLKLAKGLNWASRAFSLAGEEGMARGMGAAGGIWDLAWGGAGQKAESVANLAEAGLAENEFTTWASGAGLVGSAIGSIAGLWELGNPHNGPISRTMGGLSVVRGLAGQSKAAINLVAGESGVLELEGGTTALAFLETIAAVADVAGAVVLLGAMMGESTYHGERMAEGEAYEMGYYEGVAASLAGASGMWTKNKFWTPWGVEDGGHLGSARVGPAQNTGLIRGFLKANNLSSQSRRVLTEGIRDFASAHNSRLQPLHLTPASVRTYAYWLQILGQEVSRHVSQQDHQPRRNWHPAASYGLPHYY